MSNLSATAALPTTPAAFARLAARTGVLLGMGLALAAVILGLG
jgi:hypothetical protein